MATEVYVRVCVLCMVESWLEDTWRTRDAVRVFPGVTCVPLLIRTGNYGMYSAHSFSLDVFKWG